MPNLFGLTVDQAKAAWEAAGFQRNRLDVTVGEPNYIVGHELVNGVNGDVVGGRELIGKPLLEAMPELRGQGYDEVLRSVIRAGEPVVGREALIMLEREGRLQETYWTFIFSPLRVMAPTSSGSLS